MKRKSSFLLKSRCPWKIQCAGDSWTNRSEAQSEKKEL